MPLFVDEDGKAAEPPVGISPISPEQGYARLQALVMADLHEAGLSIRKIGMLFRLPKSSVDRILKCVPDDIAGRHRNEKYLNRLRRIVDEGPVDFKDLMARMLAANGTQPERVASLLQGLGNRRRSLETAVGLKQRKAEPQHAEPSD